jgi:hypothetical protein
VRVIFNPTSAGYKIADLLVQSNDPSSSRLYSHIWGYKDGVPSDTPVTNHLFTYTRAGSGTGTVYFSSGESLSESFSTYVPDGTEAVITPVADKFSRFIGWSGCDSLTDNNGCRITMHGAKNVTATFDKDTKPISIAAAPAGGIYQTLPQVTLVANKEADIYYTLNGATPTTSSTRYTGPIQLTGNTTLKYFGVDANSTSNPVKTDIYTIQTFSLTTNITGTGSGSVNSSPAGINITSGTASAAFIGGTPVTLFATPEAGSQFSGWSGACTGSGDCTLTMDANKTVTATFNLLPNVRIEGTLVFYSFSTNGVIQARNITFTENLLLGRPVSVFFEGGYFEGFLTPPAGFSVLSGQLTIGAGSLIVDRLVIR